MKDDSMGRRRLIRGCAPLKLMITYANERLMVHLFFLNVSIYIYIRDLIKKYDEIRLKSHPFGSDDCCVRKEADPVRSHQ